MFANLHETFTTCSYHLHDFGLVFNENIPELNKTKQQEPIMKNNIESAISVPSFQIDVAPRFVSALSGIVAGIQNFVARLQLEQIVAKRQMNQKRQMKVQLHQDTINQMSLDQKLKLGLYHH
jgi:hypothetical protein